MMRSALLAAAALTLAACAVVSSGRLMAQDLGLTLVDPAAQPRPHTAQRLRGDIRPGDPARVLVIGDSLAQGFGTLIDTRAEARGLNMEVVGRGLPSSGLARSDFYDWPANFRSMVSAQAPDIVVAHFGANDMQSVIAPEGRVVLGTEEWDDAYRAQIRKIYDIAVEAGAVVYWLGPAPDANRNLGPHLERLNPIFEAEALAHRAAFVALTPLTAPTGKFERTVVIDGETISMRTADGSHFTGRGYAYVADAVLDRIVARFPETGPLVGTPAVAASGGDPMAFSLQ